jgi:two-component system phosphate regulon response regulator OmpR
MTQEPPHILVVDDDTRLRALLRKFLADNGFRVSVASDAGHADRHLSGLQFDLIVLDRMMPGEEGLSFARRLRGASNVPILMLTAMGEVDDRIDGLETGVDDYLAKPFEPRELLLRIRTILRRVPPDSAPDKHVSVRRDIALGEFRFVIERGELDGPKGPIRLTTAEASLLRVLAESAGRVLSREDLSRRCDISGGVRTIDVQVTRLRRKFETDPRAPRYLQTIRGRGYVLRPDE